MMFMRSFGYQDGTGAYRVLMGRFCVCACVHVVMCARFAASDSELVIGRLFSGRDSFQSEILSSLQWPVQWLC